MQAHSDIIPDHDTLGEIILDALIYDRAEHRLPNGWRLVLCEANKAGYLEIGIWEAAGEGACNWIPWSTIDEAELRRQLATLLAIMP